MTRELLTLAAPDSTGTAPDDAFGVEEIAEQAGLEPAVVETVMEAVRELDYEAHPWRDPEVLKRLYHGRGLTRSEIGERLGCSEYAVRRWMDRHDMKARASSGLNGLPKELEEMDPDSVQVKR